MKILDLLGKCVNNVNAVIENYKLNIENIKIIFFQDDHQLGYVVPNNQNSYTFALNKRFNQEPIKNLDLLELTIYHELCHILQYEYGFEHWFTWNDDNKTLLCHDKFAWDQARKEIYGDDNQGHTELWWFYAEKLNKAIDMKYKICATLVPDLAVTLFKEMLENSNMGSENLLLPVFNYPFSLPTNITFDILDDDNLTEHLSLKVGLSIPEALKELKEENLILEVKPL